MRDEKFSFAELKNEHNAVNRNDVEQAYDNSSALAQKTRPCHSTLSVGSAVRR